MMTSPKTFLDKSELEIEMVTPPAQAGARSAEVQPRRGDCAWPC